MTEPSTAIAPQNCAHCGCTLSLGAKFCDECGSPVPPHCPRCGMLCRVGAKYCSECGTQLNVAVVAMPQKQARTVPASFPASTSAALPPVVPPTAAQIAAIQGFVQGERCQLTVMFCDLVGSTGLAEQLDPEDMQNVLRAYHEVCAKVINRFEGHIAKYLGDGLLVYFGYPRAHEDDGHRAVRAGLGIVNAVVRLAARIKEQHHIDLAVRVGIHTGLVVIGEIGAEDRRALDIVGETPNIAARLQEVADPNAVVLSHATERLVHGYFECQPLGSAALKGVTHRTPLYRAVRESAARSRLEAAATSGALTPLVGRQTELNLLINRWEQSKSGEGQVVLLGADPGVGKSRLLQALKEHVARDPQAWLTELYCSSQHQNSAFHPAIDLLERASLQFTREDTTAEKLAKLEGFAVQFGFVLEECVPLIAEMLSIPLEGPYAPLTLSPERRKQKILDFYQGTLMQLAKRQPLLFVIEDLHWIDPSTLEWILMAIQQASSTALMVVCTYRPLQTPLLPTGAHITRLQLERLDHRDTQAMVERVAGGKKLPPEVLRQIVAKVEGVPLFVEEFTKMVIESGLMREEADRYVLIGALPTLAIPSTLQDSLLARLNRLSTVREVALWGAVLGREFSYELLAAVAPLDEVTLLRDLSKLVAAELIYSRATPDGEVTYRFKHALLQDAAYESLLKSRRQFCHGRVAEVLELRFPHLVAGQPELLAHHLTEAGQHEQAIQLWKQAGERAIERSAHLEARRHLTIALELLTIQPETSRRHQQELQLQIRLGVSLTATRGYGLPEVRTAYARARELGEKLGDTGQSFLALYGMWRHHLLRAEYPAANALGVELLTQAAQTQDPSYHIAAHRALAATCFYLGDYADSRSHVAEVMNSAHTRQYGSKTLIQDMYDVVDPRVTSYSYEAWSLWQQGFPDQALRASEQAIALAQEIDHPFSLALAHCFAAWLHQFRRSPIETLAHARAAIDVSMTQEFPFWVGWARVMRGWAWAQSDVDMGLQEMRDGLVAWQAQGSDLGRGYFLSLQAEICLAGGLTELGLQALTEAEEFALQTGERWWESERCRLRGELILQNDPNSPSIQEEAAGWFWQALDVARSLGAQSLALRAAMSLYRLSGREAGAGADRARVTLEREYAHFTEGLDTPDLMEAHALLNSQFSQVESP